MAFRRNGSLTVRTRAFTLIEMMVSTTIAIVILVLMVTVVMQASAVWRRSSNTVEAYQSARLAYEVITRNLSQATLNTYLDYDSPTTPTRYLRKSELAFRVGAAGRDGLPGTPNTGQAIFFQGPLGYATNTTVNGGLEALLNTCGYYISYTTNNSIPTHVASGNNPYRYRLMQMLVPSEKNDIYKTAGSSWFSTHTDASLPIADNVIALIVRPQDPAATSPDITADYTYDSRANATANPQPSSANQMPPVLQVTTVAIDEVSAGRLSNGATPPSVIEGALAGRFSNPATYDADLDSMEKALTEAGVSFRVFSSAVPIRESKWTK